MTIAPMPPDRRSAGTGDSAEGMVQFAGEPSWSAARFVADEQESVLLIDVPGDRPVTRIALVEVTAMDELIADRPDHHHIEMALDRRPVLQAVWPQHFTTKVLAALATTVDADPPPAPRWAEPVAEPVVEPVVDLPSAEPLVDLTAPVPPPPLSSTPTDSPDAPRRRTSSALIGVLALAGCTAIVVGALGLSDGDTSVPVGTKVLTQTTLRSPVSTVPAPTTTLVLAAVDPCVLTDVDVGSPTTIPDECEA